MLIGLPKEIKDNEYRVGLTPGSVQALTRRERRSTLLCRQYSGWLTPYQHFSNE